CRTRRTGSSSRPPWPGRGHRSRTLRSSRRRARGSTTREILDAIHHNSVVVIHGATGCGKTTQVPLYILDLSSLLPAPLQSFFS
uniref:Uncharacterized protein n=1 Tax=Corvus moneduloides TaxID=1196302 RepID=A0A8C3EA80_CORMO